MAARHDLVTDPGIRSDLLLARRGTAYFSRKLNELPDAELYGPSRVPGWSRAHVVAHVGYHARELAGVIELARTGARSDPEVAYGPATVDFGATLPPGALRNLHAHAAVHLNVEWRDLPPERWERVVTVPESGDEKVSCTPWLRAREVWLAALDLDNGARREDLPVQVRERLPLTV